MNGNTGPMCRLVLFRLIVESMRRSHILCILFIVSKFPPNPCRIMC